MRAEEFRTFKHACVYNHVEKTFDNEFKQDHTDGDYRLVTLGVVVRLNMAKLSDACLLASEWNSMVRNNKWSSRATDKNISLSELPISKSCKKILGDLRAGRINKSVIIEKHSKDIVGWKEIPNYITALYFTAQLFKDPMARFKQALSVVIGEKIVNQIIPAELPYANLLDQNTYATEIHANLEKVKPIDIVGIPLLAKYRDEAEDGTRYVPFVICQNSVTEKLFKNAEAYNTFTSKYSANTPQGCLKHLKKIYDALDICWFE
jgi:hypothetical protein